MNSTTSGYYPQILRSEKITQIQKKVQMKKIQNL